MAQLGQIFYGRDRDGYGVLGVSPAGRSFVGAVAALCRAVGSPDRPGDVRPFLLSKQEGDAILMIRACRGAGDPTGRATIFFHALVADRASLRAAGLDAFALANAGMFADSCSDRELPDLPFPSAQQQDIAPAGNKSIELPATISAERPLDELVRQELGVDSLNLNWATFTFNPLSGFDICVLSAYSPHKGAGTQYVFDNGGLRRLSLETVRPKTSSVGTLPKGRPFRGRSSLPLVLSLIVNAVLVITLLLSSVSSDDGKPEESHSDSEMTESDAREKWESKWKAEWAKSLPPTPTAMTEADAKAKWAAQWKSEWEKSLPSTPSAMAESEAKAKWEESWRKSWIHALRMDFEKSMRESGGEWPILFDDANSPFTQSIRSSQTEPKEEKLAQKWRIYRSCKTCADFIHAHLNQ